MVMLLGIPLLYRIVFAILGSLFFHMKLRIALSRSVKNCIGIWMDLYCTCRLHLVKWPFFTMLFLPIYEHERSFHLLIIFLNFVLQKLHIGFSHALWKLPQVILCYLFLTNFYKFLSQPVYGLYKGGLMIFFLVNFLSSGFAERMK